jgi:hypothetical protein
MISKWCLFVAGVAGLLFCFSAGAQTHGSAAPGRMGSVRVGSGARAVAMQPRTTGAARLGLPTARQSRVTFVSPSGRLTSGFAPTGDFAGFESDDVPGLGFDFPHLAAISGALHNGSFRFGHHEHNGGGAFVPIWFGGYPFYYDDSSYEQAPQQAEPQPQIIVIQQPAPAQPVADSAGEAENAAVAPSAPQTSETVRDVGEFILVRRDGRIVFASMFSVVGEQLLYITPEGMRHTIPVAELDADATQQMNEARGTTVQLHN